MDVIMEKQFQQDMIKEFGIDRLPQEQREEALVLIAKIIGNGVIIRAVEILDNDEQDEMTQLIEEIMDSKKGGEVLLTFFHSKISNLNEILKEEVQKIKEACESSLPNLLREKRKQIVEDSAKREEALGDLIRFGQDITNEFTAANNTILGVSGLLLSLAYDPASALKTNFEKEKRFTKKVAIWFAVSICSGFWLDVTFSATAYILKQEGIISVVPKPLLFILPEWYKSSELSVQLTILAVLPFIAVLIAFATIFLLIKLRPFKLFFLQKKIKNTERVSFLIQDRGFLREIEIVSDNPIFTSGMTYKKQRKRVLDISRLIYSSIFINRIETKFRHRENEEVFDILLSKIDTDEEAIIRFLKPKIKNYSKILKEEIYKFLRETIDLMPIIMDPIN